MKNLLVLDGLLPMLIAALVVATTRDDGALFLSSLAFASVLLGLVITSLMAPFVLWKRHGLMALAPLLALTLAGTVSTTAAIYGSRAMLTGTAASPDTFIRGTTQRELEETAKDLLSGARTGRAERILTRYGLRAEVDSIRRVVLFEHYRMRRWYTYLYAAEGLGRAYSTAPHLTRADILNWGALREIAEQAAGETSRPRAVRSHEPPCADLTFEPAIAIPLMRQALGDSHLLDLRRGAGPRPITAGDKEQVIAALNEACSVESRLIENPAIRYQGNPLELHIGPRIISHGFWVTSLLTELVQQNVLRRAPDGMHLVLRDSLTVNEERRVEWLQVGLLDFICGELLNAHDYTFERQLQPHWYFQAS